MSWGNFKGQDRVISILRSYLSSERIPNAFIFSGIRGVGKFSIAKEFAKASNCAKYRDRACDECANCIQIEREVHPDLFVLKPGGKADEITIDMIREVEKFLNLSPQKAERKFFLIDEAERMNMEASNAFLKSLEEPPLDSTIILITTKPDALLPTIRSRCQEIRFSPLSEDVIKELLIQRFGLKAEDAEAIAKISCGSLSSALQFKGHPMQELIRELDMFFSDVSGFESAEAELHQMRKILRERIESLAYILRDKLLNGLGLRELTFSKAGGAAKGVRELVGEIEKLDYYYSALEANVNPLLVYRALKGMWEEVKD